MVDDIVDTNKYFSVPKPIIDNIIKMKAKMDSIKATKKEVEAKQVEEEKAQEEERKNNPNASGTPDNMCMDGNDPDNRCTSKAALS